MNQASKRQLGIEQPGPLQEVGQEFARSLAVVIGINDYDDPLIPNLQTPRRDADRMREVLEHDQNFRILELITSDATHDRLLELFQRTLPNTIGQADGGRDTRLLVYFAGHGTVVENLDDPDRPEYFLVPKDANATDGGRFIDMRIIHDALLQLECRHLLLVLDCCYAGGIKSAIYRNMEEPPPRIYRERYDFYVRSPAWQVLTSAAFDEKALDTVGRYVFARRDIGVREDNSPFAAALLEALQGAADANLPARREDAPGDGLITATELYAWVRDDVQKRAQDAASHPQTPGLWPLEKHHAGENVFRNPKRAPSLEVAPELTPDVNPYLQARSIRYGRQTKFSA